MISALFRYPVKSMEGERLEAAAIGPGGLPGDRGWAVVDRATGRPLSAKRAAVLMLARARYLEEPRAGAQVPPAEAVLPDGERLRTDDPASALSLSRWLGGDHAFAREPSGGGFFDAKPLHLVADADLKALEAEHGFPFAPARFRPNVLLAGALPAAAAFAVGGVVLDVLKPTKRCVMTTLPQPGLSAEPRVLRVILGRGGDLGVYAKARGTGTWRVGDRCATI